MPLLEQQSNCSGVIASKEFLPNPRWRRCCECTPREIRAAVRLANDLSQVRGGGSAGDCCLGRDQDIRNGYQDSPCWSVTVIDRQSYPTS